MTTISGTTSTGTTTTTATTSAASASASASYNTFLTLLTTQLKNQDPLNPTNTDTFTSEMIQLSGVEQELAILSTISSNLNSMTTSNGLGYIGKTVSATGSTSPMQGGTAQWSYTLNAAASNVKLSVEDSSGETVYSTTGDATSGTHNFSWNGQTSGGGTLTSGDYKLNVTATDSTGKTVTTTTDLIGKVTGVDSTSGTTNLKIGDIDVPLANVSTINS